MVYPADMLSRWRMRTASLPASQTPVGTRLSTTKRITRSGWESTIQILPATVLARLKDATGGSVGPNRSANSRGAARAAAFISRLIANAVQTAIGVTAAKPDGQKARAGAAVGGPPRILRRRLHAVDIHNVLRVGHGAFIDRLAMPASVAVFAGVLNLVRQALNRRER